MIEHEPVGLFPCLGVSTSVSIGEDERGGETVLVDLTPEEDLVQVEIAKSPHHPALCRHTYPDEHVPLSVFAGSGAKEPL